MFCGKCGAENIDGAKFCKDCGNALVVPEQKKNENNNTINSQNPTKNKDNNIKNKANKKSKKPNKLVAFLRKSKKNKIIFFGSLSLFVLLVIAAIIAVVIIINNNIENRIYDLMYESSAAKTGIIPSQFTDDSPYHMEDLEITKFSDSSNNGNRQKHIEFNATILNDFFMTGISGEATFNTSGEVSLSGEPHVSWSDTVPIKGVSSIDYKTDGTTTEKYDFDISSFSSSIAEENGSYKCVAVEGVEFNFGFCVDKANLTQNYIFDKKNGWKEVGQQEFSDKQTVWTLAGKTFVYDKISTSSYGNDVSCNLTFKDSDAAGNLSADFTIKRSKDKSSSTPSSKNYTEYYDINKSGSCSGPVEHKFGEETFVVRLVSKDKMVTFNISRPTIKVMENTNEKVNSLYVSLSTELITSKYVTPTKTTDGPKYYDGYVVEQQTNKIKE